MWLPRFGRPTELFAPAVQPVLLIDDDEVVAEFHTLSGKARPGEQPAGKKAIAVAQPHAAGNALPQILQRFRLICCLPLAWDSD